MVLSQFSWQISCPEEHLIVSNEEEINEKHEPGMEIFCVGKTDRLSVVVPGGHIDYRHSHTPERRPRGLFSQIRSFHVPSFRGAGHIRHVPRVVVSTAVVSIDYQYRRMLHRSPFSYLEAGFSEEPHVQPGQV